MTAVLAACGLAREFPRGSALRDATLDARRGEILCVLGASGSGKSTLLRLLALVDAPTRGSVLLDGDPVAPRGPTRLAARRRMALVQQTPGLLRETALSNVAFPLRARSVPRERAENESAEALARVDLASKAEARPHELSGGEAQRVALARALVAKPDVLLLDEATNQVDPAGVRRVEALLREVAREAAVVLVTHSVAQARRVADRVAFLARGEVAGCWDAAEFFARPPTEGAREFVEWG